MFNFFGNREGVSPKLKFFTLFFVCFFEAIGGDAGVTTWVYDIHRTHAVPGVTLYMYIRRT